MWVEPKPLPQETLKTYLQGYTHIYPGGTEIHDPRRLNQ